MKKLALTLVAVLGMAASTMSAASACDDDKGHTAAAAKADQAGKNGMQKVSLEGKVVTSGCPMEAAKQDCTGAALVVGETKHPIKTSAKGKELAGKAKDTDKVVKVTGTRQGEYLTVTGYEIKG